MKYLLSLFLLSCVCLAQQQNNQAGNPCFSAGAVTQSVTGSTSGTASVQIVALGSGQKVFVCSLIVVGVSGTTPTFSLQYGTGSNCASGTTVFIGAWTTTANTVYSFGYPVFIVPSGNAICYLDSGTSPIQRYTMMYIQQ